MSQLEKLDVAGHAVVDGIAYAGLGLDWTNGVCSRRHSFDAISGVGPPVDHVNEYHCPVLAGIRILPGLGMSACFACQSTAGKTGVPGALFPRTSMISGP